MRREIELAERDRDRALAQIGRMAITGRWRIDPAARTKVERLEGMLAERLVKLPADGAGLDLASHAAAAVSGVVRPRGPQGEAAAALSDDGRWAAVTSGKTIELIDLDSPEKAPTAISCPWIPTALAIAPGHGSVVKLAAGSERGDVHVWQTSATDAHPPAPTILRSPATSSHRAVACLRYSREGELAVGRLTGPVELTRTAGPASSSHNSLNVARCFRLDTRRRPWSSRRMGRRFSRDVRSAGSHHGPYASTTAT